MCFEFRLRKASLAHVSNHNKERPELVKVSLACRFIGVMPFDLRLSSTVCDITGDMTETLWPSAAKRRARYMAGRMDPSRFIIMSHARV